MADSTVRIGADLSQLRRELAKLPNLSGDAAQKTPIKVERPLTRAENARTASARSTPLLPPAPCKSPGHLHYYATASVPDASALRGCIRLNTCHAPIT